MRETHLYWRKAYRSEAGGNCVEIAVASNLRTIGGRDSKIDVSPIPELTPQQWTILLASLRRS